ncbi:hypothetical protein N1851_014712 [Merluccius polli]|uniref:Uncharacterized protein n=1 Tax=Merluccius polli TaxID=89951 RepID=A0AA47MT20_MERPO|nr:hypothetical protein N1851_014712 [Merluccius polli]
MTEATALSAIEKTTVGIYVTRETPGNDFSDVGIIIEGVVFLQDLDNVSLATALLFGLFYSLNMSYPSQLCYTFEVIQKVVMELDVTQLSRKAQSLKTKLLQVTVHPTRSDVNDSTFAAVRAMEWAVLLLPREESQRQRATHSVPAKHL